MRTTWAALAVSFALVGAACGPAAREASRAPAPAPATSSAAAATADDTEAARATSLDRGPVVVTTTPMAGEPSSEQLRAVRLVAGSCQTDADVEQRVADMKAMLDRALQTWREDQPFCGRPEGKMGHRRDLATTTSQIASVDEADIVKTDGAYVYVAANGALRILEALEPRVLSVTHIPGDVRELFVEGDRAVVVSASGAGRPRCTYGYDCEGLGDGSSTTVRVFDISDRHAPKAIRQIDLTGSLLASRRIGAAVHVVVIHGSEEGYDSSPPGLARCGMPERIARAKFAQLKGENERKIRRAAAPPKMIDRSVATSLCTDVLARTGDTDRALTSLVSFDMTDAKSPAHVVTVRSRGGIVFASEDAVYLATQHFTGVPELAGFYPSSTEISVVHKFRLGARPSDTRYVASGVVPGHALNALSMDQWHGYLRVATTTGTLPQAGVENAVSVVAETAAGDLVRVGAAQHLARGEDIRAVRFDDDRAYVFTFDKMDPLDVIDLHDVVHPRAIGELKIPGLSTSVRAPKRRPVTSR